MEPMEILSPAESREEPETVADESAAQPQELTPEQLLPGGDAPTPASDDAYLKAMIEAVVYIIDEPLSASQIASAVEQPLDKVQKVLKIVKEPISLETPIGDEEESSLGDFVEDELAPSPVEAAIQGNLGEQTRKVLATLTPREEQILRMRFGIGQKTDYTLEEVGKQFAVTRERIRQIEAKALRKLRHPSRSRKLRAFMDGVRD